LDDGGSGGGRDFVHAGGHAVWRRTQPQPTQGPVVYDDEFDWKTAVLNEEFDTSTARPLTPQEEHAYYKGLDEASRDPARILTNLEHSSLYDWRQEQDDAVSRFFEGASDIPGNLAQIAVDATKETAQNYAENYRSIAADSISATSPPAWRLGARLASSYCSFLTGGKTKQPTS
jgi:hypothetical protein